MSLVLLFTDYKNAPIRILYPFHQLLTNKQGVLLHPFVYLTQLYL